MTGGGGGVGPTPPPPSNGGEFLLQLLQKPHHPQSPSPPSPPNPHHHHHHHLPPWVNHPNNPNTPNEFHGFHTPPTTQNTPWGLSGLPPPPNSPFSGTHHPSIDFLGMNGRLGYQPTHSTPPQERGVMMFGSVPVDFRAREGVLNGNLLDQLNREVGRMNLESQFVGGASGGGGGGGGSGIWGSPDRDMSLGRQPWSKSLHPPGFPQKPKRVEQWGSGSARREKEGNVDSEDRNWERLNHQDARAYNKGNASSRLRLSGQIEHPGPPVGSRLQSVPALDIEQSLGVLHGQNVEEDDRYLGMRESWSRDEASDLSHQMSHSRGSDDMEEYLMNSVRLSNGWANNMNRDNNSREDIRVDISRELHPPFQRTRNHRRVVDCRNDIDSMNTPFLAIFDSLVPPEEEKAKQKQLLTSLEKLVNKEWPNAQLYLYGSCANSFGVSKSDIDVCLAIEDENINKSELLLRLADILQEDNLQNVQALTRARVPIVKLMDPVTGISCDICVNNVLAVVNTKLLRDYAQIDDRLRQLAFIVKHWAKSRGVNVTYHGTLSSYAYVLMCIHFLQQRRPAILPCLQGMKATYVVRVDDIECAYFDQVQNLRDFGARNKEKIAQLVWSFFDYWAYRHDYTNAVISVRTGSIISKRAKDWTRRIGNDRHLICIEDPFEVSHDLGRVVDKYSIKILREEFERAADIMQYDPNPCVTLFEPYVPTPK